MSFNFTNLKGGLISITIGAILYIGVVRNLLIKQDKGYINPYNKSWTVENKIFRPMLFTVLPFVGGFCARLAGNLMDGIISVLRMFIFNDDNGRVIPPEDKYFSAYTDFEADHEMYREGFATSLLMIGIGLTIATIYVIV